MASGGTDDIDIVGTHALLHGSGADVGCFQMLLLQEVGLELDHARCGEQERWVVGNK